MYYIMLASFFWYETFLKVTASSRKNCTFYASALEGNGKKLQAQMQVVLQAWPAPEMKHSHKAYLVRWLQSHGSLLTTLWSLIYNKVKQTLK